MPELPEVETVARQLAPHLVGREVLRLRIHDRSLRRSVVPRIARRRIEAVGRSGKRVLIRFSSLPAGRNPVWLAVHLRMTGRLVLASSLDAADRSRPRARLDLDRDSLLFLDTRRFGTFDWYAGEADAAATGLDPTSPAFTPAALSGLTRGGTQAVKVWLLRQDRLCGLGNIYASEILHAARVSPFREVGTLDRKEIRRLHGWTRRILLAAVENCGTTFSDFQDAHGLTGSYGQYLVVYGREGQPCRRCGDEIRRIVQQQRSTYYCESCQVDIPGASRLR